MIYSGAFPCFGLSILFFLDFSVLLYPVLATFPVRFGLAQILKHQVDHSPECLRLPMEEGRCLEMNLFMHGISFQKNGEHLV